MADDKSKIGEPDRNRVSVSEDFEVQHFARENGMTVAEVLDLIKRFGNDREKLEDAVKATRRA